MRDLPAATRYAALRWNAPLSEDHAEELLDHLDLDDAKHIVDLGCGWASCFFGPRRDAIRRRSGSTRTRPYSTAGGEQPKPVD